MIEFLKWLVAGKEMDELSRWRVEWNEYRRWLAEFPHVAMSLDNMRSTVAGSSLDACHPPGVSGPWTIQGLRHRLRQMSADHIGAGEHSSRHDLQKGGNHPAPCARFCEATAFEIEIRRLRTEAQGAAAAKAVLSQFYHASKGLIDSGGSPEACRKFDDAEAKVLAIIGIVEQDTKTREDHQK